ncbi:putative DNA-binding protein [Weissella thailandensis]|uniref:UPF0122 protein DWV05_06930 n=1 Tax=Weissella thailandensis TaxID=89061 RepID=A0ABX9I386_9LACO|nr:putative DNA-binding protein [Weissella thailandensis]NKY91357.1 putative DNA-binding protein [Weissella thailandensis]RDS59144.1 putative DNA-binding protein [Weissella thailandensis]GEP74791.1 UPF0122 protein [Weissella thailandensis]
MELEKSMRLNMLFDFYQPLLTVKQNNYLQLYYADDYSLGEIAEEYQVSRQAVYDNIKRSTQLLENYEDRLHLYDDYQNRQQAADHLNDYIQQNYPDDEALIRLASRLLTLEEE